MGTREASSGTQLTVAGFGAVALGVAALLFWLVGTDSGPESHTAGFAVTLAALVGWLGLLVTGIGLRIPAGERWGIAFSRGQRYCFLTSTIGTLGIVVVPVASLVMGAGSSRIPYFGTMGSLVLGVGALAVGVLWRTGEEISRRYDVGSSE
ncbi:hypothetical protein SAMN05216559_0170 [Halomicrobium zhouii]|uniref:Uncharacterized protein n=1 Tax=Halomicrobium zhouii TaxID=767519 RepID=A0A1I6K4E5_9EURY|nr:hypothetical protein [Halomicrobium zhouii]SFR86056.1 hypothetical protein SAMN05216559_0170 [Halomicrobium zhouii]